MQVFEYTMPLLIEYTKLLFLSCLRSLPDGDFDRNSGMGAHFKHSSHHGETVCPPSQEPHSFPLLLKLTEVPLLP